MNQKIMFSCVALSLVLAACAAPPVNRAPEVETVPLTPAGKFCCGVFSENEGEYVYAWSNQSDCGIPENIVCAGSCPALVNERLCATG